MLLGPFFFAGSGNNSRTPAATTIANLQVIYTALLIAGICSIGLAVLLKNTVNSGASALKETYGYINTWIRDYATRTKGTNGGFTMQVGELSMRVRMS
jgi:hypothetical protein